MTRLLLLVLLASTQHGPMTLPEIQQQLPGHIVALRVPFKGEEIVFASDGKPVPPILKGTFGRDGLITIESVKADENGNVIFRGHRAVLLSFEGEPLHPVATTDKVRFGLTAAADEVSHSLARVILSPAELQNVSADYNRALRQSGRLGNDREVVTDCRLTPIATPVAREFWGKKLYARILVNELGEPEAVFFTRPITKKSDKDALLSTLWNWRFAPLRRNGKLASCSHELVIDASKAYPRRRF